MKNTWMIALTLLGAACATTTPDSDPAASTEGALAPIASVAEAVKPSEEPTITCANVLCASGTACIESDEGPVCIPTLTCANVLCAPGTECVESDEGPTCVPSTSCANVDCQAGYTCVEDCESEPACVPLVCEGFAGLQCPDGFECKLAGNEPDQGGSCEPACGTCGECTSNEDCEDDSLCTTQMGECLTSCECPECDVCAGFCVGK